MVPRPRPLAAGRAISTKARGKPTAATRRTRTYPRMLLAGASVVLVVACSGSGTGDEDRAPVDVTGVSVDASPDPDPDPVDAGDVSPDDSPNDRPDPEGSGGVAVDGGATPDADGGAEGSGDAVAQDDAPTGTASEVGESGTGESGATEGAAGEAVEDEAVEDEAVEDEVGEGEAVEDEVGEDEAAESEVGEDGAGDGGVEAGTTPENSGTIGIGAPEEVLDRPRAPLTGEPTIDTTLAQRRALAVKVGNSDRRSRPQAGLAAADIVYETLIEGGESRFLAVFHSEIPGRVGPVRSVRTSDFNLLADLSRPYLASSGANVTVLSETRRAERAGTIVDIGGMRTFVPYSRDPARRSPHNLYFHSESLIDSDGTALRGGPLEAPVVPLLDYGSSNPAGIAGANGVTVTYHRPTGNVVSHIWDAAAGGWVRIQDGDLMMTETGSGLREVAPVNVAVVWMTHRYAPSDAESPLTQSYGTGDALVLTAGAVHEAVWERSEDRAGFRFVDTAGNPLSFSPGSTWILIANSSRRFPVTVAEVLAAADGARLLDEAREAADAQAGTR